MVPRNTVVVITAPPRRRPKAACVSRYVHTPHLAIVTMFPVINQLFGGRKLQSGVPFWGQIASDFERMSTTRGTAIIVVRIRLGNRSIFYPHSSVGDTFTFGVVQVTGSNLTSNVSFTETLARAHLKTHISLDPQVMKRSG